MDSTSVGGGPKEPEAPEVMFEVFPPAWDVGVGVPVVPELRVGKGDASSWGCWGRGNPAWVLLPAWGPRHTTAR